MRLEITISKYFCLFFVSRHKFDKIVDIELLLIIFVHGIQEFLHFHISFPLLSCKHLGVLVVAIALLLDVSFKVMELLVNFLNSIILDAELWMTLKQLSEIGEVTYSKESQNLLHELIIQHFHLLRVLFRLAYCLQII